MSNRQWVHTDPGCSTYGTTTLHQYMEAAKIVAPSEQLPIAWNLKTYSVQP